MSDIKLEKVKVKDIIRYDDNTKLHTEEQVDIEDIRSRGQSGETHLSISKDYPVIRQTITNIINHKTWRHIL